MKKPFFTPTIVMHGKDFKRAPLIKVKNPNPDPTKIVYPRPMPSTINPFMIPLIPPVQPIPLAVPEMLYTVEPKPVNFGSSVGIATSGNSKKPLTHSVGRTSPTITGATVDGTSKGQQLQLKNDSNINPLNLSIMQKIKLFYQEHKMYVNIALGAVVAYFVWKFTKKKR